MGAAEISAGGGGQKNSFREGDYKKRPREGGLFSKLRVWVGRGSKEKFSFTKAILESHFFKKMNIV